MTCPFCNITPPQVKATDLNLPQLGALYLCGDCGGLSIVTLDPRNKPCTKSDFDALDDTTRRDLTFAIRDILAKGRMKSPTQINLPDWITILRDSLPAT